MQQSNWDTLWYTSFRQIMASSFSYRFPSFCHVFSPQKWSTFSPSRQEIRRSSKEAASAQGDEVPVENLGSTGSKEACEEVERPGPWGEKSWLNGFWMEGFLGKSTHGWVGKFRPFFQKSDGLLMKTEWKV